MGSAGAGPRICRVRFAAISHGRRAQGRAQTQGRAQNQPSDHFAARQHHASRLLECCAYREGARFGPLLSVHDRFDRLFLDNRNSSVANNSDHASNRRF